MAANILWPHEYNATFMNNAFFAFLFSSLQRLLSWLTGRQRQSWRVSQKRNRCGPATAAATAMAMAMAAAAVAVAVAADAAATALTSIKPRLPTVSG